MATLKEKILNGAVSLGGSSILVRLTSFLTVISVTHFLSIRDYGVFVLFISVAGPFNILSGLGMDELITADVARSFGEKDFGKGKRLLAHFFKLRLVLLGCLLLGSLVFKDYLKARYGVAFEEFFIYLVLFVLAQYARNVIGLIFSVNEKFGLIAKLNATESIAKLLVILIMIFFLGLNLQLVIIANILSLVVLAIIFFPKALALYRALPESLSPTPSFGHTIFGHGKWQVGSNIVASLMASVNYWLMKVIVSTEAVAIFSLAQSMFSALASLIPFKTIMTPIIARKSGDGSLVTLLMERATKYSIVLFSVMILFGLILVKPLVVALFPKYLEAIPVFSVLIFKLIFNSFSFAQVPLLYAQKKQKFLFAVSLLDTLLVLILASSLMFAFGIVGRAYESLITLTIVTSLREWYIRKNFNARSITFRRFFSFDTYDRLLLKACAQMLKARFHRA